MPTTPINLTPVSTQASPPSSRSVSPRSAMAASGLVALTIAMFASGHYLTGTGRLLGVSGSMLLMLGLMGTAINRNVLGALINENNVMSLARLQMAVWTVLVLGAYLTYALARVSRGDATPLNIAIDWHLWAMMGISTASLVGSPLVLSTKTDKDPDADATAKTASITQETPDSIDQNRNGLIYVNSSPTDAKFTDIFQGDEVGNTTSVDLAKVQMFLFTLIAGLAFFWAVRRNLSLPGADLTQLPLLSDGTVWLMGISHGGYLISKGVDHTKT